MNVLYYFDCHDFGSACAGFHWRHVVGMAGQTPPFARRLIFSIHNKVGKFAKKTLVQPNRL